jgi:hypothetical protein
MTTEDIIETPVTISDLGLLRRFEPVVRYTRGEQFYPLDVEQYIQNCSLWVHSPDGHEELLQREDQLTVDELVEPRFAEFGSVYYLRFVEPLSLSEAALALTEQVWSRRKKGNVFRAGQGRLSRGGYLPRILDALFTVTLLLRGRVPAATAASAELNYLQMQKNDEIYPYYGRVVRQTDWIVLQYWFLYAYNNWRSGFHGVNDHEADWETILVYLYEQDGLLYPEWVSYASHEFKGDDLRRRWDDREELELVDGHPIVYAGAGSHAAYYRRGEYQAEVDLALPKWLSKANQLWQKLWGEVLGMGSVRSGNPFRIPFVDYARGDGLKIGPSQDKEWTPVLIDEQTPWVSQYRGLWGLYARDPISGENAPGGPMYNRDGTPRQAWYDPLGYAGMDKVSTPPAELLLIEEKCASIIRNQARLETEIALRSSELQMMGVEVRSMEANPHLAKKHTVMVGEMAEITEAVKKLKREKAENEALLQCLQLRCELFRSGQKEPPQAHIRRLMVPVSNHRIRFDTLTETWAAVSLSFLLLSVAALAYFAPQYLWVGLGILAIIFAVFESFLRGTFIQTVSSVTSLLAVIVSLVLIFHFWFQLIVGGLVVLAMFLLVQKVRELRG